MTFRRTGPISCNMVLRSNSNLGVKCLKKLFTRINWGNEAFRSVIEVQNTISKRFKIILLEGHCIINNNIQWGIQKVRVSGDLSSWSDVILISLRRVSVDRNIVTNFLNWPFNTYELYIVSFKHPGACMDTNVCGKRCHKLLWSLFHRHHTRLCIAVPS